MRGALDYTNSLLWIVEFEIVNDFSCWIEVYFVSFLFLYLPHWSLDRLCIFSLQTYDRDHSNFVNKNFFEGFVLWCLYKLRVKILPSSRRMLKTIQKKTCSSYLFTNFSNDISVWRQFNSHMWKQCKCNKHWD